MLDISVNYKGNPLQVKEINRTHVVAVDDKGNRYWIKFRELIYN